MDVILQVFIVFAGAMLAGEVAVRLRQPAMVGELVAGLVLGPHVLGWIHVTEATSTLSALGVVVLLFAVGLEMRTTELAGVGAAALSASVAGVVATVGVAFGLFVAFGYAAKPAVQAAIALAATSAGIAARVLADAGALRRRASRIVLGAAVVDDVIVLVALSVAFTTGSAKSGASIAVGLLAAVGFVVLVAAVGPALARRHGGVLGEPTRRSPFVLALALCLGLAALSERIGLAALIGAFLAGMALAETKEQFGLEKSMEPLYEFLVPFFFVVSAARLDPHALADAGPALVVAVAAATIAAKVVGCGAGAAGLPLRERLVVGAGMAPRGEVTVAAATSALAAGTIPQALFSTLVAVVFVSTLVTPVLLGRVLRPKRF
jgi:Kef-type K+ transport system membrane component KefB